MKSLKLTVYLLLFLSCYSFAQPTITIKGISVISSEQRGYVAVTANDFTDIARLELVLYWDKELIAYDSMPPSTIALDRRIINHLENVQLDLENYGDSLKVILTPTNGDRITVEDDKFLFEVLFKPLACNRVTPLKIGGSSKIYRATAGTNQEIDFWKEESYFGMCRTNYVISEVAASACGGTLNEYTKNGIYTDAFITNDGRDSLRILDLTIEIFQDISCKNDTFFIPNGYTYLVLPTLENPIFSSSSWINISPESCKDNITIKSTGDLLDGDNVFKLGSSTYNYIFNNGLTQDSCQSMVLITEGASPDPLASIKIAQQTGTDREFISVDIIVENFQDITAVELNIEWDNDDLFYVNTTIADVSLGGSVVENYDENKPGMLNLKYVNPNGITLLESSSLLSLEFLGRKGKTNLDFITNTLTTAPIKLKGKIGEEIIELGALLKNGFIDIKRDCSFNSEYREFVTICTGEKYEFNGLELFEAGIYRDTFKSVDNCDSIVVLNLTTRAVRVNVQELICEGETYLFKDRTLSESGIYRDTFVQPSGCDSIVELELFIKQEDTISYSTFLCEGGFIKIKDTEIKEVGLHEFFYPNTNTMSRTCGTRYFIEVEFLPSGVDTFVYHQTICERDTIVLFNTVLHTEGLYEFPSETIGDNNCTVLFFVDLEVIPPSFDTIQATICQGESYLFGFSNRALTESGFYYQNVQSSQFCDSITVLSLEVLEELKQEETINICQGETYTIGNQTLTETGVYETMLSSQLGCDSLVITNLIVEIGKEAETDVDLITCEEELVLAANLPDETKGAWTGNGLAIIDDTNIASTNVTNLPIGESIFYWTLSSEKCLAYSRDSITITRLATPSATQDSFLVRENTPRTFDVTTNDSFGEMNWLVLLNTVPMVGQLEVVENGIYQYTPPFGFSGQVSFEYQICNEFCLPEGCTTTEVVLTIQSDQIGITMDPTPIPPSTNFESSKIKVTNPTIEIGDLFIFNIWGQQVAKRQFFQDSQEQLYHLQQNELPAGIYFYVKKSKDKSAILESGKIVAIGR